MEKMSYSELKKLEGRFQTVGEFAAADYFSLRYNQTNSTPNSEMPV